MSVWAGYTRHCNVDTSLAKANLAKSCSLFSLPLPLPTHDQWDYVDRNGQNSLAVIPRTQQTQERQRTEITQQRCDIRSVRCWQTNFEQLSFHVSWFLVVSLPQSVCWPAGNLTATGQIYVRTYDATLRRDMWMMSEFVGRARERFWSSSLT